MRFLHPEDQNKELTYSDVFLVPQYSQATSRMDVSLIPSDNTGATIPVAVANMTAVAGKRMSETVARRGGITVLPQDMPLERLSQVVRYLKTRDAVVETPVVLREDHSIQTALNLIHKRSHRAVMVVNKENKPTGIFMEKDAFQRDRFTRIRDAMSKEMISMPLGSTPQQVFERIRDRRVPVMPIIDPSGALVGVLTEGGALRGTIYKPALNQQNQFITCVAIGVNQNVTEKMRALLEIGIDIIVLDTAHGHQQKMIEAVRTARAILGRARPLVAGNVVTAEATKNLVEAGASIVKVGVGPGAMCTTRMMTGVGRPQFSAVVACSKMARSLGAHVWADGGIKTPRDAALAIAAGASSAFIGTWFAGTYESAADTQRDEDGMLYKENFGMASARAVTDRNRSVDAFSFARKHYFQEGVSTSKLYLKPGQESAEDIIDAISAGIRSACTYTGARNLEQFHHKALIGAQSSAGFEEGKPHQMGW